MPTYRIADWISTYENNRTRELKRMDWVPIPNRMDGEGYTALVDHPNGAAHFGAWIAIVEIASRRKVRGTLPEGGTQALARMSQLPASVFEEVIPRLAQIGWLVEVDDVTVRDVIELHKSRTIPQDDAGKCDAPPLPKPQDDAEECLRARVTEGNGTEGNGREEDAPRHTAKPQPIRAPSAEPLPSLRFEEFWGLYPQRTNRAKAETWWFTLVNVENEAAVFACLERFLASADVSRGFVRDDPAGWLQRCQQDKWESDWARAREPPGRGRVAGTFEMRKKVEASMEEQIAAARYNAEYDMDPAAREASKQWLREHGV